MALSTLPLDQAGNRPRAASPARRSLVIAIAALALLIAASLLSMMIGDTAFSPAQVIGALAGRADPLADFIIVDLRLPRALTAILVGATLGMAGVIIQSMTRNPIGSPDLMGVSAGASLAIVACMAWTSLALPLMLAIGTLGGFVAGGITFLIAWKTRLNPLYLSLAGMCVALFFNAAITVLLLTSATDTNGIYFWLTGSLMDRTWQHAALLLPVALCGLIIGQLFARPLNLLMLDDLTSRSLGFPTHVWRLVLGIISVTLTATTVAVAGPISFVGLIAPHLTRLWLAGKTTGGSGDHRLILPVAAVIGAALLSIADAIANYCQVPAGILCALVGGPLFIRLIHRQVR